MAEQMTRVAEDASLPLDDNGARLSRFAVQFNHFVLQLHQQSP